MQGATAVGLVVVAAIFISMLLVIILRKTHIRMWRFGIFFESEERFGEKSSTDKCSGDNDESDE